MIFGSRTCIEILVVAGVARQVAAVQIVDDVDYRIEEFHVVRYEKESVFVVLQVACQPDDMLVIQIVGRLIENQNRRIFQQQQPEAHWFFARRTNRKHRDRRCRADPDRPRLPRSSRQLIEAAVFRESAGSPASSIISSILSAFSGSAIILIQLEHFRLPDRACD